MRMFLIDRNLIGQIKNKGEYGWMLKRLKAGLQLNGDDFYAELYWI
jgi:hypothetical protein